MFFSGGTKARSIIRLFFLPVLIISCTRGEFDVTQVNQVFSLANIQAINLAQSPVDITFVIDNSGSMELDQANLAMYFGEWIDQELVNFQDLCFAVVTSDDYLKYESPNQIVPNSRRVCTKVNGVPVDLVTLKANASAALNVGFAGSSTELIFSSLGIAYDHDHDSSIGFTYMPAPVFQLTPPAPWLRQLAKQAMIFLTDEQEQSQNQFNPVFQYSGAQTKSMLDTVYGSLGTLSGEYFVVGIYDYNQDPGNRYRDFLAQFSHNLSYNIADDFSQMFTTLGTGLNQLNIVTSFQLEFPPEGQTVVPVIVYNNGTTENVPNWAFSVVGQTLFVDYNYLNQIITAHPTWAPALQVFFYPNNL